MVIIFILIVIFVAAVVKILNPKTKRTESTPSENITSLANDLTAPTYTSTRYVYDRKSSIMTNPEVLLYRRLSNIVKDRYVIFPQIHLSSLAVNKTYGKYHKLGFQRINRRSVDYVLADPETLRAVYAVELDDSTHDTEKGRSIDALKTDVLSQIGMPLVRLRNINSMSDEDIIELFKDARTGG